MFQRLEAVHLKSLYPMVVKRTEGVTRIIETEDIRDWVDEIHGEDHGDMEVIKLN